MRFRLTIFGGNLLDIDIQTDHTDDDIDERLTFGFASVTGTSDINDDTKALDTSDRSKR